MPGVWGIVVAAGTGERFGRPKQFAKLGDRTVVEWSVAACRSVCEGVVLVLPADHMDDSCGADAVVVGGATRSESVRCGLGAVPERAEVVIVHDAARPLASSQLFQSVVDALMETSADGVICALPVSDTLKRIDGSVPHAGGSK